MVLGILIMKIVKEHINESFIRDQNQLDSIGIGIKKLIKDWMISTKLDKNYYIITQNNEVLISSDACFADVKVLKGRPKYINLLFKDKSLKYFIDILDTDIVEIEKDLNTVDKNIYKYSSWFTLYVCNRNIKQIALIFLNNKHWMKSLYDQYSSKNGGAYLDFLEYLDKNKISYDKNIWES